MALSTSRTVLPFLCPRTLNPSAVRSFSICSRSRSSIPPRIPTSDLPPNLHFESPSPSASSSILPRSGEGRDAPKFGLSGANDLRAGERFFRSWKEAQRFGVVVGESLDTTQGGILGEGPGFDSPIPFEVHLPLTYFPHPSLSSPPFTPPAPSSHPIVALPGKIFSHPLRRDILHRCVVHYLTLQRQGTANTKGRGEVRGSGRKIMRQKGTGKARVGDVKSPTRRCGGVVGGPRPKNWSTKLNRKVREMGLRVALSEKWRSNQLHVTPPIHLPVHFTKSFVQEHLRPLNWTSALFIQHSANYDHNLHLASRNVPEVDVRLIGDEEDELSVFEVLKRKDVVLDLGALEWLCERLDDDYVPTDEDEEIGEQFWLGQHAEEAGDQQELTREQEADLERLDKEAADDIVDRQLGKQTVV